MKSWLAQGSSGRRVTLLSGTTFLHINGALVCFILLSLSALLDVVNNITTRYLLESTTECVLECLANNNHVLAINQEQSQQKANERRLKVANMTLLKRVGLKSQWGYLAKKQ